MKSNKATRSIIETVRAVVLTVVLAMAVVGLEMLKPDSVSAGRVGQTQSAMDSLKGLTGEQFEKEFLSMMIQHRQGALDMSKYAAQNAGHQEVKDTAQKIISDQTSEIGEMTGWLKTWYNSTPTPNAMGEMPGMGMSDMMNLANLKGDDFDKQFLTMMRMHHMSAIEMAQLVPERATPQELKTLGQNIISSQTSEIQQFQRWLKSWYNIDASQMGEVLEGMMSGGQAAAGSAPIRMPNTGNGTELAVFFILGLAWPEARSWAASCCARDPDFPNISAIL